MTSTLQLSNPSVPDPGGACFYLDLPRELRDIIHSYALTYMFGLISAPNELCLSTFKRRGPDPRDDSCWWKDPAPWVPKLEPCLQHERPPSQEIERVTMLGDPNPLRLVCHQTRAETHGLLLDLNNIRFIYRHEHCNYYNLYGDEFSREIDTNELFRLFYHQCSATDKNRLRRITIERTCDAIVQTPEAHNILAGYMRDYAHYKNISFLIRFRLVHDNPWEFHGKMTQVFSLVLKGPQISRFAAASLKKGLDISQEVQRRLLHLSGSATVPHNVHFLIQEESSEHVVKA
ncbi:hypothetical protein GT037_006526 [Alternaria burnsii]|uniref:Uncharacterized protein n=1 Tax=Alternaria burnsii TaxID=1187904 RepID=A0A8H7EDJ7_9PLEO|nr:uncharacterized protein GT037_006526 [Alternaria burnsii]KAF7675807.1 hypothetical protein GT037_006526 [Alternaria burnsii]